MDDDNVLLSLAGSLVEYLEPSSLYSFLSRPEEYTEKFSDAFQLKWKIIGPQTVGNHSLAQHLQALSLDTDYSGLPKAILHAIEWKLATSKSYHDLSQEYLADALANHENEAEERLFTAGRLLFRMPDSQTIIASVEVSTLLPFWPKVFYLQYSYVSENSCCNTHSLESMENRSAMWGYNGMSLIDATTQTGSRGWQSSIVQAKEHFLSTTASAKDYGKEGFDAKYWDQYDVDEPTLDASNQGGVIDSAPTASFPESMTSFDTFSSSAHPSMHPATDRESREQARERHFAQIKSFGHGVSNIPPDSLHVPSVDQWTKPEAKKKAEARPWLQKEQKKTLLRKEHGWTRGQERPQYPWANEKTSAQSVDGISQELVPEQDSIKDQGITYRSIFRDHVTTNLRSMKLTWLDLGGSVEEWRQILRRSIGDEV